MINTVHGRKFYLLFLKFAFWELYLLANDVDITSYAENNTPYKSSSSPSSSKTNLAIIKWRSMLKFIFYWVQKFPEMKNAAKNNKLKIKIYNILAHQKKHNV